MTPRRMRWVATVALSCAALVTSSMACETGDEASVTVSPADDEREAADAWPMSDNPSHARLGMHELRIHPLWRTPVDRPCPTTVFAPIGPNLHGGDMFDRITEHRTRTSGNDGEVAWLKLPTSIVMLHDHVGLPGLRLVLVSNTASSCMLGWTHTHCFVDADAVYCPDGTTEDLERLVRAHQLEPRSLSEAGWFELAMVMTGVEHFVVDEAYLHECVPDLPSASALAPAVTIEDEQVTIRFTAIEGGRGTDHTIRIERSGKVDAGKATRWYLPRHEVWLAEDW
jgi:hypothetical protein